MSGWVDPKDIWTLELVIAPTTPAASSMEKLPMSPPPTQPSFQSCDGHSERVGGFLRELGP